jgi:hypothetical protein
MGVLNEKRCKKKKRPSMRYNYANEDDDEEKKKYHLNI